jgi:hypothetical protein
MRSIPYGSKGRHKVDLYLPCAAHPAPTSQEADASDSTGDSAAQDTEPTEAGDAGDEAAGRKQGSPVVVFITGGAWMIGYRAWGALLARRLSISGVLVACVDYGNFPLSAQDVSDDAVWAFCVSSNLVYMPDCCGASACHDVLCSARRPSLLAHELWLQLGAMGCDAVCTPSSCDP